MAWQQRNGRRYYYRSRREGGRVTHDYFVTGPLAWTVAKMDAGERERQQAQAEAEAALRRLYEEADALVGRLIAASKELVEAVLLADGFYRHQRGLWRRRSWAYAQRPNE